jgi:hypothetical protein
MKGSRNATKPNNVAFFLKPNTKHKEWIESKLKWMFNAYLNHKGSLYENIEVTKCLDSNFTSNQITCPSFSSLSNMMFHGRSCFFCNTHSSDPSNHNPHIIKFFIDVNNNLCHLCLCISWVVANTKPIQALTLFIKCGQTKACWGRSFFLFVQSLLNWLRLHKHVSITW